MLGLGNSITGGAALSAYNQFALSFDGTNDFVNTGATFQSTFRNSFSVSCWQNTDNYTQTDTLWGASSDDNNFIKFGDTGTADFYIGHNPDNSCNLFRSHSSNIVTKFQAVTENMVVMTPNAAVELYYDGAKKFETSAAGATITGNLIPEANNTRDLGADGTRWANIYTNDLNLSNEGNTNDVDGSWGSFTIQEGEDDLFLINRRNGKKYKFNLTEVS